MKKNSNSINIQINDHVLKNGVVFYNISIRDTQGRWNIPSRFLFKYKFQIFEFERFTSGNRGNIKKL